VSSNYDFYGHDFRERVVILDGAGDDAVFLLFGVAFTFFFGVCSPLERLVLDASFLLGVPRF